MTYESESDILGRFASQSQMFWTDLRVRVRYFGLICESESDVLDNKKRLTTQSQMFFRVTCDSESDVFQATYEGSGSV